jgi:hypothetical protein
VGLPVNIAASISRADLQDQPRAAVLVGFGLWVPLLPAVSGGRPRATAVPGFTRIWHPPASRDANVTRGDSKGHPPVPWAAQGPGASALRARLQKIRYFRE